MTRSGCTGFTLVNIIFVVALLWLAAALVLDPGVDTTVSAWLRRPGPGTLREGDIDTILIDGHGSLDHEDLAFNHIVLLNDRPTSEWNCTGLMRFIANYIDTVAEGRPIGQIEFLRTDPHLPRYLPDIYEDEAGYDLLTVFFDRATLKWRHPVASGILVSVNSQQLIDLDLGWVIGLELAECRGTKCYSDSQNVR